MNDQISSDEKNIISLMERWAPVVYFHPKEKFFPSSVDFYLNSVELVDESETKKTILPPLTADIMRSYSDGTMHSSDKFYLNIPDNDDAAADLIKKGEKLHGVRPNLKCRSAIYCQILRIDTLVCDLQYWMFYPNDDPVGWFDSDMGAHEGDWEHVSVRLNWPESYPEDGSKIDPLDQKAFNAIYGSAHSGEGSWNDKPTWECCSDGTLRPAIYAAQGTHANYSTLGDDGTINRAFSDDYVSNAGAYWETFITVVQITWSAELPNSLAWLGFNGRWGATRDKIKVSSPTGPAMKSQFTTGDPRPTNPMVPKSG